MTRRFELKKSICLIFLTIAMVLGASEIRAQDSTETNYLLYPKLSKFSVQAINKFDTIRFESDSVMALVVDSLSKSMKKDMRTVNLGRRTTSKDKWKLARENLFSLLTAYGRTPDYKKVLENMHRTYKAQIEILVGEFSEEVDDLVAKNDSLKRRNLVVETENSLLKSPGVLNLLLGNGDGLGGFGFNRGFGSFAGAQQGELLKASKNRRFLEIGAMILPDDGFLASIGSRNNASVLSNGYLVHLGWKPNGINNNDYLLGFSVDEVMPMFSSGNSPYLGWNVRIVSGLNYSRPRYEHISRSVENSTITNPDGTKADFDRSFTDTQPSWYHAFEFIAPELQATGKVGLPIGGNGAAVFFVGGADYSKPDDQQTLETNEASKRRWTPILGGELVTPGGLRFKAQKNRSDWTMSLTYLFN